MDKENVIYIHKGLLFSHKKEWNSIICGNMDESGGHYIRPDTERQISHDVLICGI
jgi:hypothetical protein